MINVCTIDGAIPTAVTIQAHMVPGLEATAKCSAARIEVVALLVGPNNNPNPANSGSKMEHDRKDFGMVQRTIIPFMSTGKEKEIAEVATHLLELLREHLEAELERPQAVVTDRPETREDAHGIKL